jgi:hypothetical protein
MNNIVAAVEMLQKHLSPSNQGPEHVSSSGNAAQTSLITIARNSPAMAVKSILSECKSDMPELAGISIT